MGDLNVKSVANLNDQSKFSQHLLNDVKALEIMLENGLFDIEATRIGAEQELCLVDEHLKPASICTPLLKDINNPDYVTELAKFNIEVNYPPLLFKGDCLSKLEQNILNSLDTTAKAANKLQADIALAGILPTIRKFDLDPKNMVPFERYKALMEAITRLRGSEYELKINGIDELNMRLDSAFVEGCNTGFQVHMQIKPDEFVEMYNIAQAIAAPVLAISANSPFLFGKRLWKETRIALFQQSVDTRVSGNHLREKSPRVTFGNSWLKGSILDIYREDIMRFRVLLHADIDENSLDVLNNGGIPKLKALTTHNSTVYRWNRPCYGIGGDKPHLRIENRILPSGPSAIDEVANSAFWFGLMNGMKDEYPDITKVLDFDDAKSNFTSAATYGLDTKFNWIGKSKFAVADLIKQELIPIAKQGLSKANIDQNDIDKYLNIIEERSENARNGAQWMLHSYSNLNNKASKEESLTAITATMIKNQKLNVPVHKWPLAKLSDIEYWKPSNMLVEEFMKTDIFTVHPDDLIELVAQMMDWKYIRNVPVEDDNGNLVGLVTSRILLRHLLKNSNQSISTALESMHVKDIMLANPKTISPGVKVADAKALMEKENISCLPVIDDEKLVGLITENNFLAITSSLMSRLSDD